MPLPLLLAALPGIAKGITGLIQGNTDVQRTDSTPAAFKEQLAGLRVGQNARMPGYGLLQNRFAQAQAGTLRAGQMGAASSGDFLASAAAADSRRQQSEQQLGVQQQQYRDQATRMLNQGLQQQAQHQQADDRAYNQAKAALKGSSLTNMFGGLSDIASVGAYGLSSAGNGGASLGNPTGPAGTIPMPPPSPFSQDGYDDYGDYQTRRRNPLSNFNRISTGIFQ